MAYEKLIHSLEDYRQKKYVPTTNSRSLAHLFVTELTILLISSLLSYGQTLFSRYIKEMVCAMDINDDKLISKNELGHLLQSIGVKDVTNEDITAIMEQFGEGEAEKQIHVEDVEKLILRGAQQ